jgi:hypothetical protein
MYYLRLLIGIIEEREFEERTTKDFLFTFLFKTPDGKKTENGYTTDINTLYTTRRRERKSRGKRERRKKEKK